MYEYKAYVISGGSGFIGKQIVNNLLQKQAKVYVLTRRQQHSGNPLLQYIQWDVEAQNLMGEIPEDKVCVIHLAGTNVADKRWSEQQKKLIVDSRVKSALFLHRLIQEQKIKASYVAAASAIGYYGEQDKVFVESDAPSNDFLGSTCKAWEDALNKINELNIPLGILRIGLVLGLQGGAVPEFLNTLKFRLGVIPANGKQIYSWIHLNDIARLFLYLSEHKLSEVYNAVAPKPCTAEALIKSLGKYYCKGKFASLHMPAFVLKIVLGEFSIEILKSAHVDSAKIQAHGFQFLYADVDSAVKDLFTPA